MNIVLVLYEASTLAAWMIYGRPNPMNLGFFSKSIELVAILVLTAYTAILLRSRSREQAGAPARAN